MEADDFKSKFYGRTYKYALDVLRLIKKLPVDPAGRILKDQLARSATSVAANLVEAKAASSKRDYINFYSHSLKSANESFFWLNLIRDYFSLHDSEIDRLLSETDEIAKILGASIRTMRGRLIKKS